VPTEVARCGPLAEGRPSPTVIPPPGGFTAVLYPCGCPGQGVGATLAVAPLAVAQGRRKACPYIWPVPTTDSVEVMPGKKKRTLTQPTVNRTKIPIPKNPRRR